MFCSKCGANCDEGVSFCPNCGSSLNSDIAQTNEKNTAKKPAKPSLKIILIFVVIFAVALTGIILLTKNGEGYSSPEKLAKAYVEAVFELDSEKLVSCLPDFMVEKNGNNYGLTNATRKELAKALKDEIKKSGEAKQKVEIISVDINRELSTGYDMFDYFGISSDEKEKISQVVELKVKCSLDNGKNERIFEIVCFEESNKWYILNVD